MKASLSYEELIEAGHPRLSELQSAAKSVSEDSSPEANAAFSRQVVLVEASVRQTYGLVAQMARKAESLEEVADIWRRLGSYCESALQVLAELKAQARIAETEALYDLVLDYKLACDDRRQRALEEKECLKLDFPKGIFPDLN